MKRKMLLAYSATILMMMAVIVALFPHPSKIIFYHAPSFYPLPAPDDMVVRCGGNASINVLPQAKEGKRILRICENITNNLGGILRWAVFDEDVDTFRNSTKNVELIYNEPKNITLYYEVKKVIEQHDRIFFILSGGEKGVILLRTKAFEMEGNITHGWAAFAPNNNGWDYIQELQVELKNVC